MIMAIENLAMINFILTVVTIFIGLSIANDISKNVSGPGKALLFAVLGGLWWITSLAFVYRLFNDIM